MISVMNPWCYLYLSYMAAKSSTYETQHLNNELGACQAAILGHRNPHAEKYFANVYGVTIKIKQVL